MSHKFASALLLALTAASCQATPLKFPNQSTAPSTPEATTYGPPPQVQFDVSEWRNYSDQFLAFKYPPDWRATTEMEIEPGSFTIDLYDRSTYYSEGGSVMSPIQINYKPDTYGSSIGRLFTNPIVQQTVQKQHIRIGGKDAYVLKGPLPPGNAEMRVVFTNNMVFDFDSNAHSLPISVAARQRIDAVFETVLATVQFR
jgi:hypothetical protein